MTGVRLIIFLLVVACLIGVVVLLGSAQCRPEVESNDTEATADGLGTYPGTGCRSGTIFPAGDVDMYWFEVAERVSAVLETRTQGDTLLSVYESGAGLLGEDDDGGVGRASRLEGVLEPGVYVLVVSAYGSNTVSSYEVWVQASAATSAAVGAECPWEEEPNDTASRADVLSAPRGTACRSGTVTPAGDVDVYSFALTSASRVVLETETDGNTVLRLYDEAGRLLAEDDDGGDAKASRMAGSLAAGRYYATVRAYGDDATIGLYRILLTTDASSDASGTTSTVSPPPSTPSGAPGPAPSWGWSIYGGGIVLSAWGAIDRDCPSDYDFNMGLCDKDTHTFTLGTAGFIALALIDQAGDWITAYVYDAGGQRVAAKLGVSGPIYSGWHEVPPGTYTVDVVPGKRLDNSPYELHAFFSATLPGPEYLVQTYGPADLKLPG